MNAAKTTGFFIFLFTLSGIGIAQKTPVLIKTAFFSIQQGQGDTLWRYLPAGNSQSLSIRSPILTIDEKRRLIKVNHFLPRPLIKHPNGSVEQSFVGVVTGDTTIQLAITFRWATDNPVVRFRYTFTSYVQHHFSRPEGKDELEYFSFSPGGRCRFKEIRLSGFNQKSHATTLESFPVGKKDFEDRSSFMGPILVAADGHSSRLVAYEHGSQFPDQFVAFQVNPDYSTVVRAVKGNYLDQQPLDIQHDYQTIWFEVAAIEGNEEKLSSLYRRFVLKYLSDNTESRKPYIYYNTWGRQERTKWAGGKYLSGMNLATTRKEIEVAHQMGIEVYVLDAGWFSKTGDWEVNTTAFPDTLKQVKALLDQYGMKLGLWFNPTVASVSSMMLQRNRNNQMERHGKKDDPYPIWETENSVSLDLVSPYWNDFADKLIQLVQQLGVVYFKWDAVGQYGCDGPGHFHGTAANSEQERADSYAFQLPVYMSKVIDKVCAVAPQAIFDFDITEPGRSVGLSFLASGKYFIMNNGPYFYDYDLALPGQTPLANGNTNIFVNPGSARGWFTRAVLAYDQWIPSILFLTHYQPDEPRNSQLVNIASLILGQNGIWGEILKTSPDGIALFHNLLEKYKQVRNDITLSDPLFTGTPGGSPEIIEKINTANGKGAVVLFAGQGGHYRYITDHAVDKKVWHSDNVQITFDKAGRAVLEVDCNAGSAAIVFFGIK